ncbi:hypothetical protein D9M68_812560 [compost metagenome]
MIVRHQFLAGKCCTAICSTGQYAHVTDKTGILIQEADFVKIRTGTDRIIHRLPGLPAIAGLEAARACGKGGKACNEAMLPVGKMHFKCCCRSEGNGIPGLPSVYGFQQSHTFCRTGKDGILVEHIQIGNTTG